MTPERLFNSFIHPQKLLYPPKQISGYAPENSGTKQYTERKLLNSLRYYDSERIRNRSVFDEVITKTWRGTFLTHGVVTVNCATGMTQWKHVGHVKLSLSASFVDVNTTRYERNDDQAGNGPSVLLTRKFS